MPTIQQIIDDAKNRYRHTYLENVIIGWLDTVHIKMWKIIPRDALPVVIILNGSGMYALPPGVQRRHIKRVTMGPQAGPFITLSYEDINEDQAIGYSVSGDFITLTEPKQPIVGVPITYILFIYFDKVIPTSLVGLAKTAKPEIDETFHEALTVGLLEMIAGARKDIKMKNNYASEFNALIGNFMLEAMDNDPEYPSCRDDLPRRAGFFNGRTMGD